jgi:hypothetical protein
MIYWMYKWFKPNRRLYLFQCINIKFYQVFYPDFNSKLNLTTVLINVQDGVCHFDVLKEEEIKALIYKITRKK